MFSIEKFRTNNNMRDFTKIIKELIGNDFVLLNTIEKKELIFIYYRHEKAIENYLDDRYPHPIGVGPIIFKKESEKYELLGVVEYHEKYLSEYFEKTNSTKWEPTSLEKLTKIIQKRKHINWNDFESILPNLNILEEDISITADGENDIIDQDERVLANLIEVEFNKDSIIEKFTSFLKQINFPFKKTSKNKIEFYNSTDCIN